jgi:hypothetical protein
MILGPDGKPLKQVAPTNQIQQIRREILHNLKQRGLSNHYDAAQTNSQNEMHWAMSDNLSPNAANSLKTRKILRSRSRYEANNNGYLKGILLSLAIDFVGSGPSLQVTDPRLDDNQRRAIERRWKQRAEKIKLRKKLFQLRYARTQDGETFLAGYRDRNLKHPIKRNQRVFECDQISHYNFPVDNTRKHEIDGIRFGS